ncbi:MAG TPA: hypothetical protein VJ417_11605 [Candidatus Glassbacteria bacterium]|nr:hypothetical protein [Candidatus Glassbacteria bacterium]
MWPDAEVVEVVVAEPQPQAPEAAPAPDRQVQRPPLERPPHSEALAGAPG